MTDKPLETREELNPYYKAINWNIGSKVDPVSVDVFNKLVSNFWVPEKVSLSTDLPSWGTLSPEEKELVMRVFTGLTMLDTIQGRFGAISLLADATTVFEEAVLSNIAFMEQIHSKSYSSIFSTLAGTPEINQAFRWGEENIYLRKKADIILSYYKDTAGLTHPSLRRKVASVFLESFLFYSGFYLPFWLAGQAKLVATANIISLIVRDEAIHGYFIGAKFQEEYAQLNDADKAEIHDWTYDLLDELYDNETQYTANLYDPVGITEDVKVFLRYNANRALQNLGFDPVFPHENPNPIVLNQISGGSNTHDFFSNSGNSYSLAQVEELDEGDWDF